MSEEQSSPASPGFFGWPKRHGSTPALSVVVPMLNEAGGAGALISEIANALAGISHEIIIVDDGSSDSTLAVVRNAAQATANLRLIRHKRKAGQSRALRTGIIAARAPMIATLDGDGQNDPADIPALFTMLQDMPVHGAVAMVAGERRDRQDSAAKKWASTTANNIRRRVLKDGAADTGCGLKLFYREAYMRLPYFDHMHRYLPALMRREGFGVEFAPVAHRPRVHGASKYSNFGRFMVAIRDLLGVVWLLSRAQSPESIQEEGD